jgi:FMN phosphatase YigB (HAD superfamily)
MVLALDLDDTLYHYRALFPEWGASMDDLLAPWGGATLGWRAYTALKDAREHFSRSRFAQYVAEKLQAEQVEEDTIAKVTDELTLRLGEVVVRAGTDPVLAGVPAMFAQARAQGVGLVVVTTGDPSWQSEKAHAAGIIDAVDLCVVTETNAQKTEVCAWLCEQGARVWLIDDRAEVHERLARAALPQVRQFHFGGKGGAGEPLADWQSFEKLLTNHLA